MYEHKQNELGKSGEIKPTTMGESKPTAIDVNINRWYTDADISDYVGTIIRFSDEDDIDGYRDKHLYLLNGDFPSGKKDDQTRYLVAVTNAIDCVGKALPIDHFLDKGKQTRSSPSVCLEKLLVDISELASLKENEKGLQGKIELILTQAKQKYDTDFIKYLYNKLKEVNFDESALRKEIERLDNQDRRDVFDEIFPAIQAQAHVKILFPYNITQTHWLTGEILIHKNGNQYDIEVYTHDPYGNEHREKMDEKQFKQVAETIKAKIEGEMNGHINSCKNVASPYGRRQLSGDGVSCGVITSSDIVKRIKGQTLNIDKPYSYGAVELRENHIKVIQESLPEDDATRRNFLSRNLSVIDTYNSYIRNKSNSQINIKSWYKEVDIENYLDVMFQTPDFGGYQPSKSEQHSFLLNGKDKDKKFNDLDGNRYLVAVMPPIDTKQKFLPLKYFFDKNSVENPLPELLKLLTINLQNLKQIDDSKLVEEVGKALKDKKPDESLIKKIVSVLKESDFDLSNIHKYIKKHQNKANVFDEVLEALKEDGNDYAKILFPFNLDEANWNTGEIKVHKKGKDLIIDVYAHDPYGNGAMDKDMLQAIEDSLKQKIDKYGFLSLKINAKKSEYTQRQDSKDAVSSGVIVLEDIMKRVKGETLNQKEPYQNKALALREKHIENIEKYLPQENPVRKTFISRNKTTLLTAASSSAKSDILMAERKRKSLIYDLENLIIIFNSIKEFNGKYSESMDIDAEKIHELRNILTKIGSDARRINYNDKDANCIRNKYGYEDRAHSGQIRETGIPWENLALLSDICGVKNYPGVNKEEYINLIKAGLPEIAKELTILQNAILFIVNEEKDQLAQHKEILEKEPEKNNALLQSLTKLEENLKSFPGTVATFNGKATNIRQLTNFFKDERGLYKLSNSCSDQYSEIFESDMKVLRNRYKLARTLLILGESANTLTDDTKSHAQQIPFKKLITVRNKLTHFLHGKYKHLEKNNSAFEALCKFSKEEIPNLYSEFEKLLKQHREKKQFKEAEFNSEETWKKLRAEIVIENVVEDINDSRSSAKIAHEFSLKYIRSEIAKALYGDDFDEEKFKSSGADSQTIKERGQRIGRETARIKNALFSEGNTLEEFSIEITKGDELATLTLHFNDEAVNELDLYYKKSKFEESMRNLKDKIDKFKKEETNLKDEKKQLASINKTLGDHKAKTVEALIEELNTKINGLSTKIDKASVNQLSHLKMIIDYLEKQDKNLLVGDVTNDISEKLKKNEELAKIISQELGKLGELTSKKNTSSVNEVKGIAPNLTIFLDEIEKKPEKLPAKSEKLTEFDHAQRLLNNMLNEMTFLDDIIKEIKQEADKNHYPEIEYSIGVIGQQIRDLMDKKSAFMSFRLIAIEMKLDKLLEDLQNIVSIRNQGLLHDLYAVDHSGILEVANVSVLSVKKDLADVAKRYEQLSKLDKALPDLRDKVYSSKNQKSKFHKIYTKSVDDTVVDYRTPKGSKTEEKPYESEPTIQNVDEVQSNTTIIRPRSFTK